ncbi:Tash1-like protein, putative [Theileria annulata]|uniref:Tash1-like protein, putative n=1 Tax=Theileria annulata TaxID=5874 RepID=Q4UHE6_THEAN|nr:Tash1-like protein, putative [Theileria annulata]CAI73493.1 Tash1-like protein, putative [Theileria annulata]|eukprot:XP_954170.1 Tash1-like protein, putative [Theileria annulata]
MVRVNTLLLVYAGFLYHIKIVSSIVLDLDNEDISRFYTMKIVEQGVTKVMILSTPENKITEIRKGKSLIWMADPDEYVKCFTRISSRWYSEELSTIEIENPKKTKMFYLRKHYFSHFYYISKKDFEQRFLTLTKYCKQLEYMDNEVVKGKRKIPRLNIKRKRKFPFEKDGIEKTTKKEAETQTEDKELESIHFEVSSDDEPEIEPETIPVEVDSDDDEVPLDLSQYYTEPIEQTEHTSTGDLLSSHDEEQPIDLTIKHKSKAPESVVEPTEPETITVDLLSSHDEEHEDSDLSDIELQISSDDESHEDHTHQDLIILGSEPSEESHTEDNNSSTIVRTESTKPQPDISTEDTHTQTDTDIDKKTRSSLPLKKRPYKQD